MCNPKMKKSLIVGTICICLFAAITGCSNNEILPVEPVEITVVEPSVDTLENEEPAIAVDTAPTQIKKDEDMGINLISYSYTVLNEKGEMPEGITESDIGNIDYYFDGNGIVDRVILQWSLLDM